MKKTETGRHDKELQTECPQYDEDSIGAAIDLAFDRVIQALNELKGLIKQL